MTFTPVNMENRLHCDNGEGEAVPPASPLPSESGVRNVIHELELPYCLLDEEGSAAAWRRNQRVISRLRQRDLSTA